MRESFRSCFERFPLRVKFEGSLARNARFGVSESEDGRGGHFRVLRDRRNTLEACQYQRGTLAWQAQHFAMWRFAFAWQAQHFVTWRR